MFFIPIFHMTSFVKVRMRPVGMSCVGQGIRSKILVAEFEKSLLRKALKRWKMPRDLLKDGPSADRGEK